MQGDEITLFNACTDLVSLKKSEAFPLRLLSGKRPGEWVGAREFCQHVGVPAGDLAPELFATWLPDPKAHDGYVVILFYDDESKWSMAAQYNRVRLMGTQSLIQGPPAGAAVPGSSGSTPHPTAPAVER